jgi:hypothetical protein
MPATGAATGVRVLLLCLQQALQQARSHYYLASSVLPHALLISRPHTAIQHVILQLRVTVVTPPGGGGGGGGGGGLSSVGGELVDATPRSSVGRGAARLPTLIAGGPSS